MRDELPSSARAYVTECRQQRGQTPCPCCGQSERVRPCERSGPEFCRACKNGCGALEPGGKLYQENTVLGQETGTVEVLNPRQVAALKSGAANRIRNNLAIGVRKFLEVGKDLLSVKELTDHGEWTRWVEESLPISIRSAQEFMRIAQDWNILRLEKTSHDSLLPPDRRILIELCGLPELQFDALIEDGTINPDMKRGDVRRARVVSEHAATTPPPHTELPEGKYGAILADPPWQFRTYGLGGKGRSAENHYPTLSLEEIAGLDVQELVAPDCVLFLWAVAPLLPEAFTVIEAWGFQYKTTAFNWVKERHIGQGYWTRKQSEICLLGTRGKPRRLNADVEEVISSAPGRHSEKPAEVYERIERLVPGPYVELFARNTREGWASWGNDPAVGG